VIEVRKAEIGVDSESQVDVRVASQSLNVRGIFASLDQVGDESVHKIIKVSFATFDFVGNFGTLQSLLHHPASTQTRRPVPRPKFRVPRFPGNPFSQEINHFQIAEWNSSLIPILCLGGRQTNVRVLPVQMKIGNHQATQFGCPITRVKSHQE
jgi:hypothetical protein